MEKPISVELLEKYLNKSCTDREIALVKEWYRSFEYEHDYVSDVGAAEEHDIEERIYASIIHNIGIDPQIAEQEDAEPQIEERRRLKTTTWYIAAAVAAVLLVAMFLVIHQQSQVTPIEIADKVIEQVDITNGSNQVYKTTLPDNSLVWLNPGATLKYPRVFGAKARMVSMSGECFFEVTKNHARPFIISSRSIITKVWGTRFLVRDNLRSNSADVSVMTGKVSVSVKHNDDEIGSATLEKGELMVYPHQKAIYLVDKHILKSANTINEPALQMWNQVNLSFDNRLEEIIPVLNSKFHVHIKVINGRLNQFIIHADFNGFNLPDVLQALKKSINVNYEIKENNLIELK
jgi:transmembrane sensor